jgi:hypothetical protein
LYPQQNDLRIVKKHQGIIYATMMFGKMWLPMRLCSLYTALAFTPASALFLRREPSHVSVVQSDASKQFTCDTPQTTLDEMGTPNIVMTNQKKGFFQNLFFTSHVSYVLYFGTKVASSNNLNPIVTAFDVSTGNRVWCQDQFEVAGADGRAIGALYIPTEDTLYLAFTIDGTQGSESEDFRRFTVNGWIPSYGMGGGPKVSVLLPVDRYTGAVLEGGSGTFLKSELSSGKTNTLVILNLSWDQIGCGRTAASVVRVQAQAYFLPMSLDGRTPLTLADCAPDTDSPFDYTVTLTPALDQAVTVDCRIVEDQQCSGWKRFF